MRWHWLGLTLALQMAWGCGPGALPSPTVRSISPSSRDASESGTISVQVSAVLPFHVDYGTLSLTEAPTLTLSVGPWTVGDGHYASAGVLTGFLPSGLPAGSYDVTLTLADGRHGTLPNAFTIRPGHWPLGYTFDPISNQQSGRPFGITVRALGPEASTFHGNVTFSATAGVTVSPTQSGPFVDGVLVQTLELTQTSGTSQTKLTATDGSGASGQSNKFDVN